VLAEKTNNQTKELRDNAETVLSSIHGKLLCGVAHTGTSS